MVEVASASNTLAELEEKTKLHFARSAQEVWLCDEDGRMHFFSNDSVLECSALAPAFPKRVELPFE